MCLFLIKIVTYFLNFDVGGMDQSLTFDFIPLIFRCLNISDEICKINGTFLFIKTGLNLDPSWGNFDQEQAHVSGFVPARFRFGVQWNCIDSVFVPFVKSWFRSSQIPTQICSTSKIANSHGVVTFQKPQKYNPNDEVRRDAPTGR